MSVAGRLAKMTTPKNQNTMGKNLLLYNDASFEIERWKAENDRIAAEQMLLHSQREAELAKKRLEAEENRKKAIQLQKQSDKDNRKAAQERAR